MMISVSLVHTADLHLGTTFTNLPEQAKVLQNNQFQSFMNIISYCQNNSTDILLIAGDLFEQIQPPTTLLNDVRDLFATIAKTRVFIAPGNHDPVDLDSPWSTNGWPDNVHVFQGDIEAVDIPDLGVRIYGAAFQSTAVLRSIVSVLNPAPDPEMINILLLHGELVTGSQGSVYNPISYQWTKNCEADYVALGHIHQGEKVKRIDDFGPFYAYCGCPSGRGFDELGQKGVLAGTLKRINRSANAADSRTFTLQSNLHFIPIPGLQFLTIEVDTTSCVEQEDLYQVILQAVQKSDADWQHNLYKIILTGTTKEDIQPGSSLLSSRLKRDLFFCKIIDRTIQAYDLRVLAGERSLMGAFVRQVLSNDEPEWNYLGKQKQQILKLGLQAFENEVLYRED